MARTSQIHKLDIHGVNSTYEPGVGRTQQGIGTIIVSHSSGSAAPIQIRIGGWPAAGSTFTVTYILNGAAAATVDSLVGLPSSNTPTLGRDAAATLLSTGLNGVTGITQIETDGAYVYAYSDSGAETLEIVDITYNAP